MIDLYSWNTSNGRKVSIALEELTLPYRFHPIDITNGEQFAAEFLSISPNNKIPAIIDREASGGDLAIFESGAILIYLAEKAGSELLPKDARCRIQVLEWLMFQMGSIGPMFGQALHFVQYANNEIPYAIRRYVDEVHRLFTVLDKRLAEHEYLVDAYSIADIAVFPWIVRHDWLRVDLDEYANVKRWLETVLERPAVQRGLTVQDLDQPKRVA